MENNPAFPYAQYYQLLLDNQAEIAHSVPGSTFRIVDTSNHAMNVYVPHLLATSVLDVVAAARQRAE
jgi:hypothetical protein